MRLGGVNISFDFMNHAFGFSSELQVFAVTVPSVPRKTLMQHKSARCR
jgi:hypothetical protein